MHAARLASRITRIASRVTGISIRITRLASRMTPLGSRVTPLASRATPLASRATPLASRGTPLASRVTPLSSRATPLASRGTRLAIHVTPLAIHVIPLAIRVMAIRDRLTPPALPIPRQRNLHSFYEREMIDVQKVVGKILVPLRWSVDHLDTRMMTMACSAPSRAERERRFRRSLTFEGAGRRGKGTPDPVLPPWGAGPAGHGPAPAFSHPIPSAQAYRSRGRNAMPAPGRFP